MVEFLIWARRATEKRERETSHGETGYVSYVLALLFTEFKNDNSGYVIYW